MKIHNVWSAAIHAWKNGCCCSASTRVSLRGVCPLETSSLSVHVVRPSSLARPRGWLHVDAPARGRRRCPRRWLKYWTILLFFSSFPLYSRFPFVFLSRLPAPPPYDAGPLPGGFGGEEGAPNRRGKDARGAPPDPPFSFLPGGTVTAAAGGQGQRHGIDAPRPSGVA